MDSYFEECSYKIDEFLEKCQTKNNKEGDILQT